MVTGILVAAGRGERMHREEPKQFLTVSGRTLLMHGFRLFEGCPEIDEIVVVAPAGAEDRCRSELMAGSVSGTPVRVVAGGRHRQASVRNGLSCVSPCKDRIVVVHDGVRPFATLPQLKRCIEAARAFGSGILGVPVSDTLKRVDTHGYIRETVARDALWTAQTPQAFRYDILVEAHERAEEAGFTGTDDACLLERMGTRPKMVAGSRLNIKITSPEDLILAEAIASRWNPEQDGCY